MRHRPTHRPPSSRSSALSVSWRPVSNNEAECIADRLYGKSGSTKRFESEKDDTFLLDCESKVQFVLKIAHPSESPEELDFQVRLIRHIEREAPSLPIPRVFQDRHGQMLPVITTSTGEPRIVRLFSFIPGAPLATTTSKPEQRARIGELLAQLRHAMANFSHPSDSRVLAWDVTHLLNLSDLIDYIPDYERRDWARITLERFAEIRPRLDRCRRQVLHNDFNTSNLIVSHNNPHFVNGIIDFGDAVRTAIAVDVSTALLNQMPKDIGDANRRDLFDEARDVLRGYTRFADLSEEELRLIPFLSMGRLAARVLLTSWRARLFPENSRYILRNTEMGWMHLAWFNSLSTRKISDLLFQ
ncbi:serine kinase [Mesorhizobium sp. SEMIA 3007]|uniref:phosphotransferase n=1 Tax=Mesorhizobium sp. SEMIA 3007 TaxID=1862350 RepID=UPI00083D2766|nr:phosphotransferase [Mesorhizobium sp. SEMIA 3007]ODA93299.1 serine kinase [Mesorhizobium sp. SEMIA 3007]